MLRKVFFVAFVLLLIASTASGQEIGLISNGTSTLTNKSSATAGGKIDTSAITYINLSPTNPKGGTVPFYLASLYDGQIASNGLADSAIAVGGHYGSFVNLVVISEIDTVNVDSSDFQRKYL